MQLSFYVRRLRALIVISWNQTEWMEFFGIVPTFYDDAHSYGIELSRDGLRLSLTLFDLEGAIYVSIHRDGVPNAIIDIVRERCTHALVSNSPSGHRCLQIGSPEYPTSDPGLVPVLTRGIRLFIEPHLRLEFIDVESRNDPAEHITPADHREPGTLVSVERLPTAPAGS